MSESTAVVKQEYQGLVSVREMQEALSANLGGQELSPLDLDRVKFPSGGGVTFEVPGLSGVENERDISGIIVYQHHARSYWTQGIEESGGNSPPDCSSPDGRTGFGNPGGVCAECPLNEFGSGRKGSGKACQEGWLLYVLRPEDLLPLVVKVPPSSLKVVRKYFLQLTSKGVAYRHVVSNISLEKTKNATGIAYAQARLALVRPLDPAEKPQADAYSRQLETAVSKVGRARVDLVGQPE